MWYQLLLPTSSSIISFAHVSNMFYALLATSEVCYCPLIDHSLIPKGLMQKPCSAREGLGTRLAVCLSESV